MSTPEYLVRNVILPWDIPSLVDWEEWKASDRHDLQLSDETYLNLMNSITEYWNLHTHGQKRIVNI